MKKVQWILAGGIFLILIGLGTWQLYRLQWKEALIESQHQAFAQPAVSIQETLKHPAAYIWRQVVVEGEWTSPAYFVIGRTHGGKAGYHVVQGMRLKNSNEKIIVNRGWTPHKNVTAATGFSKMQCILRTVEKPCWWHPTHRLLQHELGYIDPEILQADARFYVTQIDSRLGHVDMPTLTNPHLGYAITWFLLAISWVGVVYGYWWKIGRFVKSKR